MSFMAIKNINMKRNMPAIPIPVTSNAAFNEFIVIKF